MQKLSSLILIGLFFMFISCEKDNNKPDNEQIIENTSVNNNSAILVGNSIGDNSETIGNLWKIGKVSIENETNEFYMDTVYFSRSSSNSDYVYWIMPVRNISNSSYAFIKATGIRILDINDSIIYEDDNNYTYVNGSCGNRKSSTFLTNTFLRTGETGYFLGIDKIDFDQVNKIKLLTIEHNDSEYIYSNIKVIPISYQTSDNKINVNIQNVGDKTVYLMASPYLLLDQANRPLNWSYLSLDFDITIMEKSVLSKATIALVDYDFYNGSSNKILPLLEVNLESMDFKSGPLKSSSNKLGDELFRDMKINRDIKLKQEHELQ